MRKANFRRAVRDTWEAILAGKPADFVAAMRKHGLGRRTRKAAANEEPREAARKPAPTRRRKVKGGRPAETYRGARRVAERAALKAAKVAEQQAEAA